MIFKQRQTHPTTQNETDHRAAVHDHTFCHRAELSLTHNEHCYAPKDHTAHDRAQQKSTEPEKAPDKAQQEMSNSHEDRHEKSLALIGMEV